MQTALVDKVIEANATGAKVTRKLAEEVGYAPGNCAKNAIQDLKKNQYMREYLRLRAENKGLTVDLVLDKILEGLSAQTIKTASIGGKITDERSFADHKTRLGYIEVSRDILDMKPGKEDAGPSTVVNVLQIITETAGMTEDDILAGLQTHREQVQFAQAQQRGQRRRA